MQPWKGPSSATFARSLFGEVAAGSVRGVPVRVERGVVIVAWLLTWSLATGGLPRGAPGHAPTTYWLAAAAAAVGFVLSLLVRQIAQAAVAQRSGGDVVGVTLWPFGGITTLARPATSPGTEIRVALAGPVASLWVAGVLATGSLLVDAAGAPHLAASVAGWLAAANAVLLVLNLLPGAPLDGGAVLRGVLWSVGRDRHVAASRAAAGGVVIGYALMVVGLAQFAAVGGTSGLWSVFAGWFVLTAARTEEADERVRAAFDGLSVAEVALLAPIITGATRVDDAIRRHARAGRTDAWIVVDDGRIVAVATIDDLRAVPQEARSTTLVGAVARSLGSLPRLAADDAASDIAALLEHDGRAAVVFDGDAVVGVVTRAALDRFSADLASAPRCGL